MNANRFVENDETDEKLVCFFVLILMLALGMFNIEVAGRLFVVQYVCMGGEIYSQ